MKELKIQVPEGYEIDKENSTFECIKFKPKELTYDDIAKRLFYDNPDAYYTDAFGDIYKNHCSFCYKDKNRSMSRKQSERMLAINQLMNVAYYFNEIVDKNKPFNGLIIPQVIKGKVNICSFAGVLNSTGIVNFKTEESAEKAIKILGEETVKLAISL